MLIRLQDVQKEFKEVEDLFQSEVPESKTAVEAEGGGYKQMLKAYMDIESTAFEVLYDEQISEYQATPEAFHLPYDESRIEWGEVLEELQALK
ncbi:hypothetical protein [Staphylococcus equorum]|uniref:Uncharacterized protein n=1 Tax=Staphylococcus equorum TaxID=246432 RepID=A0AAP7IF72_9STAP|nr:hypothetical protein [Staphylococcus equorum]OEK58977.1 hypothetical protein ASS94_01230 [Staphylococcus equorum]